MQDSRLTDLPWSSVAPSFFIIQKEKDSWIKERNFILLLQKSRKNMTNLYKGKKISMRHSPHLSIFVTLQSIDRWQNWHHEYWLETAHMAPGPCCGQDLRLNWSLVLIPSCVRPLWAVSCVTRIILLPPSTDTFPREISTRANSHFLPSQIRPTHTCQYQILGFLNFVIDTVMNTQ